MTLTFLGFWKKSKSWLWLDLTLLLAEQECEWLYYCAEQEQEGRVYKLGKEYFSQNVSKFLKNIHFNP